MIANYHTHTFRCGHAGGTDREYVEAAIAGGLRILGFADHTPFPGEDEGCGMEPGELAGYVESILRLKEEYEDHIALFVGLEVENCPTQFHTLLKMLKGYPLDYLILGQHAVFGIPGYRGSVNRTKEAYIFEAYCEQAAEGMQSGVFSCWAHPDIIHFAGDDALYEKKMRQLCRIANEQRLPLEINFKGISQRRNYPDDRFWRIAGEENCRVVFGCDAHHPDDLRNLAEPLKAARTIVQKHHLRVEEQIVLKGLGTLKKGLEDG